MRLRITVQQEKRRPTPSGDQIDLGAGSPDPARSEIFEQIGHRQPSRSSRLAFRGNATYGCACATMRSTAAPSPGVLGTTNPPLKSGAAQPPISVSKSGLSAH